MPLLKDHFADSEEYLFLNIESVKVTIEGVPNAVYSQGILKNRLYSEAKRVFNRVQDYDRFITITEFYNSKFALLIDLRVIGDQHTKRGPTRNHEAGYDNKCEVQDFRAIGQSS